MATTVKITEMYDLKTTVNKLGLVGVHVPRINLIKKMYPGLLKNHKFIRFVMCDVTGACASVLPADPLQVGVESGDIAPEDMFNPILYKACTNESFETLMAKIYGATDVTHLNSVNKADISLSPFDIYYSLLAEQKTWRKVMPQSGFSVRGLVPICHTLISTYGNVRGPGNVIVPVETYEEESLGVPNVSEVPILDGSDNADVRFNAITLRGKPVMMPKFPIHFGTENASDVPNPTIPQSFVLALVTPPARLHEFYYRMRVTWTVRFEDVVPTTMFGNYGVLADVGSASYGTNYSFSSSKAELDNTTEMVDTDGVDINKIMES